MGEPAASVAAAISPSSMIEKYSAGDAEYTGFYNNFEYKALLQNSVVRGAIFRKQTAFYQWDAGKAALEREKMHKELNEDTRVFMSFFTADRQNDKTSSDSDVTMLAIGYDHNISKRTDIYTVFANMKNQNDGQYTPGAASAPGGFTKVPGEDSHAVQIGIRHRF